MATRRIVLPGAEEYVRAKLGQVGESRVVLPWGGDDHAPGQGRWFQPREGYNAGDEVTVELWRSLEEIKNTGHYRQP